MKSLCTERERDQKGISQRCLDVISNGRENQKIKGIPLHDSFEAPRDARAFEVKLLDP